MLLLPLLMLSNSSSSLMSKSSLPAKYILIEYRQFCCFVFSFRLVLLANCVSIKMTQWTVPARKWESSRIRDVFHVQRPFNNNNKKPPNCLFIMGVCEYKRPNYTENVSNDNYPCHKVNSNLHLISWTKCKQSGRLWLKDGWAAECRQHGRFHHSIVASWKRIVAISVRQHLLNSVPMFTHTHLNEFMCIRIQRMTGGLSNTVSHWIFINVPLLFYKHLNEFTAIYSNLEQLQSVVRSIVLKLSHITVNCEGAPRKSSSPNCMQCMCGRRTQAMRSPDGKEDTINRSVWNNYHFSNLFYLHDWQIKEGGV